jgi:hypothetical protein
MWLVIKEIETQQQSAQPRFGEYTETAVYSEDGRRIKSCFISCEFDQKGLDDWESGSLLSIF